MKTANACYIFSSVIPNQLLGLAVVENYIKRPNDRWGLSLFRC